MILAIFIPIVRSAADTRHISYGGDAYTGIRNAAADTANNIKTCTTALLIAASLILILIGVSHLIGFFGENENVKEWNVSPLQN